MRRGLLRGCVWYAGPWKSTKPRNPAAWALVRHLPTQVIDISKEVHMSNLFSYYIEFVKELGKGPGLCEYAPETIQINATSTASIQRYNDVRNRCHIYAAAVLQDCSDDFILACDVYLPEDYATFPHIEKCLHGMTMASLQRRGQIPFQPISRSSKPLRYRLVPDRIDFELARSLTSQAKT